MDIKFKEDVTSSSSPSVPPPPSRRLTDRQLHAAVLDNSIFDSTDPLVKRDVLHVVIQYLQDEGFHSSALVVQDEANVKARHAHTKRSQLRRMKRALLDGDWNEVDHLLARTAFRAMQSFKYAVYKQQYLELVDAQQVHNALSLLQLRLKPLESHAPPDEFRDLCYLLTCKSVSDATSFKEWDGVSSTRATLVEQYSRLLELDTFLSPLPLPLPQPSTSAISNTNTDASSSPSPSSSDEVPPARLVNLLQQALAFQILSAKHHPHIHLPPRIRTLLHDYQPPLVPTARARMCAGHAAPVKAVAFLGAHGHALVSASSDQTLRLWDPVSGACMATLTDHAARVWDVASSPNGTLLASCSGDGVVKLWDTSAVVSGAMAADDSEDDEHEHEPDERQRRRGKSKSTKRSRKYYNYNIPCIATLQDHQKDCYAVRFHAQANALVSAGYDRVVRLHDISRLSNSLSLSSTCSSSSTSTSSSSATSTPFTLSTSTSTTHPSTSTSQSQLHPSSTATATATIPKQLRAFHGHRGSVTAVTFNARGNLIISASKDTSVKLWDSLSGVCVRTMSAHLGEVTSVEASLCGTSLLTAAKDNSVRLWDVRMTARALARFKGYQNTAHNFIRAEFGPREQVIVAGSEDGFIYMWDRASLKLITRLGVHSPTVYEKEKAGGKKDGTGGGDKIANGKWNGNGNGNDNGNGNIRKQDVVYRATWNARQSLLASCSHDGIVTTWACNELEHEYEDEHEQIA